MIRHCQYTVTDAFEFTYEIRDLKINTSEILSSYYVSSLFTNVPLNETIEILADWALKVNWLNTTYTLNLTRTNLVDLLSVATNGQLFQLNGTSPNQMESLDDALQKPDSLAEWEGRLQDPIYMAA